MSAQSPTTLSTDRPGWIPAHIVRDWNPNPYAYQTEEEKMPAGGLHGQLLAYLMELLRVFLDRQGLMLLLDTFLLYRDDKKRKQRIAPDLLLMPYRFPPPSAYDLDVEPPPLLVVEVTSPDSHLKDLQHNMDFYAGLGISTYLAIDAVTPQNTLREPIEVHLWRFTQGKMQKVKPNRAGALVLPEMGVEILMRKDHLQLIDMGTGQPLHDLETESRLRRAAEQQAKAALQRAVTAEQQAITAEQQALAAEQQAIAAEQQAEAERQARLQAEARLRELEEKLRKAGME
jgi:Uma2 family endonuclease